MISKLIKIIEVTNSKVKVLILFAQFLFLGCFGLFSSILIGNVTELLLALNYNGAYIQLALFVVTSILLVTASYISKVYSAKLKTTITKSLKSITIRKLFQSNTSDRQTFSQGDLIGRFNSDISSMSTATIMTSQIIKSVIILLLYVIAIGFFDLRLLLLFMIPFPLVLLIQVYIANKSEGFITPWKESMSNTYNLSQDIINNQINIRSYSAQKTVGTWIDKALSSSFKNAIQGIFKLVALQIPTVVIAFSSLVLIGAIGLQWVQDGTLEVSKLIATISLVTVANAEFNNILNMVNNIPHLIVSANRIFPIWDLEEEVFGSIKEGVENAPIIEFDDVTFTYNLLSDSNALTNVSFKVDQGDRLGIIGKSGSGKSTIMKLILGQYQPTHGSIYFKGVNIQDWDKEALRWNIASVTQDPYLISTTIRENLHLMDDSLSDESLNSVLESLKLTDSFTTDNILDIYCGEKGQNLSGGQRQRVSIARSIIKNAELILLDEATSALDNFSESAIKEVLANSSLLSTQILIAHRVTTLEHCNQILVLENGCIVESGSPGELIAKKGHYFEALNNSKGESL